MTWAAWVSSSVVLGEGGLGALGEAWRPPTCRGSSLPAPQARGRAPASPSASPASFSSLAVPSPGLPPRPASSCFEGPLTPPQSPPPASPSALALRRPGPLRLPRLHCCPDPPTVLPLADRAGGHPGGHGGGHVGRGPAVGGRVGGAAHLPAGEWGLGAAPPGPRNEAAPSGHPPFSRPRSEGDRTGFTSR